MLGEDQRRTPSNAGATTGDYGNPSVEGKPIVHLTAPLQASLAALNEHPVRPYSKCCMVVQAIGRGGTVERPVLRPMGRRDRPRPLSGVSTNARRSTALLQRASRLLGHLPVRRRRRGTARSPTAQL